MEVYNKQGILALTRRLWIKGFQEAGKHKNFYSKKIIEYSFESFNKVKELLYDTYILNILMKIGAIKEWFKIELNIA